MLRLYLNKQRLIIFIEALNNHCFIAASRGSRPRGADGHGRPHREGGADFTNDTKDQQPVQRRGE